MKRKIITFIAVMLASLLHPQDPIFTQSFMIPESLNTGFTGSQETTRFGAAYRVQWPGLDFGINTQFIYGDGWIESIRSGIGLSIIRHQESNTGYNFTQINYNHSLVFQLNSFWYFRPSISVGVGIKSFGFQNLLLEDQINIFTGVINTSTIDPALLNERITFVDFSTSVLFNNEDSWFGITLRHLTKPDISFTFQGNNAPLNIFFSAHAAYNLSRDLIPVDRIFGGESKLYGLFNYMKQGPFSRIDLGAQLVYENLSFGMIAVASPERDTTLDDSLITSVNFLVGLKWEKWKFSYSQDFTTNEIRQTGGIYEIVATYDFGDTRRRTACPKIF
ncbi:MAG: type IX secretion system membrane protein PorP/SprF [Flavobacteriaceae bacterium]|nr:MAG: type IX secretion system membrane protein PorP/SprF [Flavobacteriaceae bacterium]